nr:hypothetical protein [Gemmatimonadota bacterium]
NHPSNGSLRSLVQQHGDQVAFSLRNISQRLDEVERSTSFRLESALKQLNGLSAEVADLNRQVALAESGGQSAPDLRDARDRAIDAMSAITPVRVIERSDGTVGVLISSATVVDGWDAKELVVQSGPPLGIGVAGRSQALPETGGTPGAMLGVVNDELPGIRAQLNTFASALVGSVNTLHREGWSDVDFFDPAGV